MPKETAKSFKKSQPAMEYLVTYGWAIVLIAIVVALLFEFGAFTSNAYSSGQQAGSCQVVRPKGPETTQFISLSGLCNGGLPEYVMHSVGANNYLYVPDSNSPTSSLNVQNSITITAWVSISGIPFHDIVDKEGQYGMKLDYGNSPHPCSPSDNTGLCLEWDTYNDWIGISMPIPNGAFNQWIFVAVAEQGGNKYWYANGAEIGNTVVSGSLSYVNSNFTIGAISKGQFGSGYDQDEWFNGSVSNVQVYNTSLTPSEIQQLYIDGIGGPPIDLQSLIGWWPLNSGPNDYSGNGNNGALNGTSFLNVWTKNYNPP